MPIFGCRSFGGPEPGSEEYWIWLLSVGHFQLKLRQAPIFHGASIPKATSGKGLIGHGLHLPFPQHIYFRLALSGWPVVFLPVLFRLSGESSICRLMTGRNYLSSSTGLLAKAQVTGTARQIRPLRYAMTS